LSTRAFFALVGLIALAAGTALWLLGRPGVPDPGPVSIAPAALYAVSFEDTAGRRQALGQYQGKLLILNFWATWCGPCRDEMPGFARLHAKWKDKGVAFVGLSAEDRERVARFGRELAIPYPLWTGGEAVGELSRRLGNRLGVLPHTAIIGPQGEVIEVRAGVFSEADLERRLSSHAPKVG
jgi:thiol-disulfide isomerase/thioredoxin